jgi:hypothetical protein
MLSARERPVMRGAKSIEYGGEHRGALFGHLRLELG